MLGILATDADHALAFAIPSPEDEAVFADAFDGCADFHEREGDEGEVGGAEEMTSPSTICWSERKR